ncbi:hypothetical protein [Frigoriglobus tundricola]|uniref:Uncharacterized protein n=1 Tax=Frigoriglobus tundricola TaxID=2774151 RepID=A0A6M5YKQ1_9BACT|nr:hypothetical protein [Frigoriglobus tundricola]QJW93853.1 hypothetical protein FTUN_1365 [Frigoriglobus tundricola]
MTTTNPNPAHDDHAPSGPPPAEVIARGYELDGYDTKSVLSVPLLVVVFFVLAFATVTIIFSFIAYPKPDPKVHPGAVARNKAPLDERLNRIHRGSKDVDQPRLEPLTVRRGGDLARATNEPLLAEGNSPQLHPEDLNPTKERFPELYATGQNRLGLDKTMALSDEALKSLFPVQAGGAKPADSQHVPTASNAGRGAEGSVVVVPASPKIPAPAQAPAPPPTPKGGKP